MKYKFEKSKYPIFKIAFWILIICSTISFLTIAKNSAYFLNIKNFSPILKPITLNVEYTRNTEEKIFACFDDYCKALSANSPIAQKAGFSFISSASFNENDDTFFKTKIKNVYLALPKNIKNPENKIKNIDLYIANQAQYYNFQDIKKLKNKNVSMFIDNEKKAKEYTIYSFENSSNYIGLKNHLMTIALSFVTKFKLYLLPYCWLFISLLIFLFNKDAFKCSLKTKIVILSSIILSISLFMLAIFLLLPKENDAFVNYILNDSKNYSKTHKLHVITENKKLEKKLENLDITWHHLDSKDKKLNKIEKEKYIKNNEKAVIYFDSNSANIDMLSLINAKAKIYATSSGFVGKLIYN